MEVGIRQRQHQSLSSRIWSTLLNSSNRHKRQDQERAAVTAAKILSLNVPKQTSKSATHYLFPLSEDQSITEIEEMNRNTARTPVTASNRSGSGLSLPDGNSPSVAPGSNGLRKTKASKITSPMSNNNASNSGTSAAAAAFYYRQQYYSLRAMSLDQMDLQAALDQMRTLLTTTPQRVYKTAYYRKQTKNHWARDDPAFCALQIVFLLVASVAYCIAFRRPHLITAILSFALQHVIGIYLGLGALVSTVGQAVANNYLSHHTSAPTSGNTGTGGGGGGGPLSHHHVKQGVEWLYAFDIHCNAFLPMFIVLYAAQFFLLPVVLGKSLLSLVVSNTLYAIGFSWYFYITHLGYRALPFLNSTEVFLFPVAVVLLVFILNFVGYPFGLGFNASRVMAYMYFDKLS